jgi:hypothetical protein
VVGGKMASGITQPHITPQTGKLFELQHNLSSFGNKKRFLYPANAFSPGHKKRFFSL